MASIQRRLRKDGTATYRVGYRHHGKLAWSPTLTSAEGAAELKQLIERLGPEAALAILEARTTTDPAAVPTLADQLAAHLEALEAHATPGTVADYRRMAARTWLPHLGALPIDAVTREAVTNWVRWQRNQETERSRRIRAKAQREGKPVPPVRTYSPKSIANAQRFLSSVLADAAEQGLISKNPARGIRLPSDHEHREQVFLTADEFTRLYAHVDPHYQPLVATLYGTGMRWGEATALTVGDVELDGPAGYVTVRQAWKKGEAGLYLGSAKTRRGHRTITIAEPLTTVLREQTDGRPPASLLFTGPNGGRIHSANFRARTWLPAVAAAGLGKTPGVHALRHSHVAALARAGVPLPVVQRRLGHESITTTIDTYGHLYPDAHTGAAEAAGAALAGALPQLEG